MYCSNCGKELDEQWKNCPFCGNPVHTNVNNTQNENAQKYSLAGNETIRTEKKPKNKILRTVLIVIAVLFALFIMIGIFASGESEAEPEQKESEVVVKSLEEAGGFAEWKENGFKDVVRTDIVVPLPVTEREVNNYAVLVGPLATDVIVIMQENEAPANEWEWLMNAQPFEENGEKAYFEVTLNYAGFDTDDDKPVFIVSDIESYVDTIEETTGEEKVTEKEVKEEEYIFPKSDSSYLSEDEIRAKTAEEMFIGRNEVFARHGYIFQSEILIEHFESTPWYKGTVKGSDFDSNTVFNEFEKYNVELIKKIEDEMNGVNEQESERQAAINDAFNFVVGKTFHRENSESCVEFTSTGEFVAIGYYGSAPLTNKYCDYRFTAEYLENKDNWQWMTFVTIDGVEYYFRCFSDGGIHLAGDGDFEGWYEETEPISY